MARAPGPPSPIAKTRSKRSAKQAAPSKTLSLRRAMGIPALLVAILALPGLGLGYFWDDLLYLSGGIDGRGPARFFWPESGAMFYRPVAQGLYFLLLRIVDPTSGIVGHLLNLIALMAATAVLVALVSELAGRRAGLLAGIVFAVSGQVPGLVAWITCSQDLFAILFTLAALWFRHRERPWPALLCVALALLCKETAVVALPLVAAYDFIIGRKVERGVIRVLPYAVVGILWLAFHPGIHVLATQGLESRASGYVGVAHPERWGAYLVRYFMVLVNLPPAEFARPWPAGLTLPAVVALGALVATLSAYDRRPTHVPRESRAKVESRTAWLGVLISLPLLLLSTVMVRIWVPYYAAFPAVGLAIATGPWLARRSKWLVVASLSLFLLLGVWCRGLAAPGKQVWCETAFQEASRATAIVRNNFRVAFPSIPPKSQVVLSVGESGTLGVRGTLVDFQALKVWYRDPSIRTVSTLQRDPGAPTELVARVTSDLVVIAIDPKSGGIRTSSAARPDWYLVGRTLRNYAREVVADGDLGSGIRIMDILSAIEPPEVRSYNRRLVAMMLIGGGRRHAADSLLAITPGFEKSDARAFVERLLAEASSSESLDLAAFEAFGVSADDPETLRWMMHEFQREGSLGQAAWWAKRLAKVAPSDRDATSVLNAAASAGISPNRVAE